MITVEQQKKIVSHNVKEALKAIGLKPQVFADHAEVAVSTLNRILEGESLPMVRTINKLAAAFFCEPADLIPTLEDLKVKRVDSAWSKKVRAA